MNDQKQLCVYTHSVNGKIFYVGSGDLKRPYARKARTPRWYSHVKESGGYEINIHAWMDDRIEAQRVESKIIAAHNPPCNIRNNDNKTYLAPKLPENFIAITSEQVRAARGLLRWEQKDLAEACGLAVETIKSIERKHGPLMVRTSSLYALQDAFDRAGVEFFGVITGVLALMARQNNNNRDLGYTPRSVFIPFHARAG
jgi:transcriptional regulator with XRE-family HTH domain